MRELMKSAETICLFLKVLYNCIHQLAFFTPGICPLDASSLTQIRQSLNFRKTEWGRPQRSQQVYLRTLNF